MYVLKYDDVNICQIVLEDALDAFLLTLYRIYPKIQSFFEHLRHAKKEGSHKPNEDDGWKKRQHPAPQISVSPFHSLQYFASATPSLQHASPKLDLHSVFQHLNRLTVTKSQPPKPLCRREFVLEFSVFHHN